MPLQHVSVQLDRLRPKLGTLTDPRLGVASELHSPGVRVQDGLRREVREETGLDIEPIALSGVYKNMSRGIVALVFRCKITGGQLRSTDEASAYRWASDREVSELSSEAYAIRVLDALQPSGTPAIRQHDGVHLY